MVGRGCHNSHIAVLLSCSYPDTCNRFAVVQIRELRTCACPHPRFADVRMSTSAICGRAHVHIRDLRTCACPDLHTAVVQICDLLSSRSAICGRDVIQISAICCDPDQRYAAVQHIFKRTIFTQSCSDGLWQ